MVWRPLPATTVTIATMVTPIINAAVVAAVRFGLRPALAEASLAGTPRSALPNRRFTSGTYSGPSSSTASSNTMVAPPVMNIAGSSFSCCSPK